jgi:hypothetical protein
MATALTASVMRPKTEKTIFDGFLPGTFSHSLDPWLPRSDRTEMGPLIEEHRPRIRAPGRWSAWPSLMWWTAPAPGIEVP